VCEITSWFESLSSAAVATIAGSLTLWTFESVRQLDLPMFAWRGLLDLLDILTATIVKTWLAILCLALPLNLCTTDNLCGVIVSTKAVKVLQGWAEIKRR